MLSRGKYSDMGKWIRRSREEGELERALTKFLDDPPDASGLRSWVWDPETRKGSDDPSSLARSQGPFFTDHILETRFLSAMVIRRLEQRTAPLTGKPAVDVWNSVWRWASILSNGPSNLCRIDASLYYEKTAYFNPHPGDAAQPMTERLSEYLSRSSTGLLKEFVLADAPFAKGNKYVYHFVGTLEEKGLDAELQDTILQILGALVTDLRATPWMTPRDTEAFEVGHLWVKESESDRVGQPLHPLPRIIAPFSGL